MDGADVRKPLCFLYGREWAGHCEAIVPELAQELRTHVGQRTVGYLFETNRATCYSPRRIQYMVKETAAQARITKRVYPPLLRHSVATTL